jgi:small subunit ribosomal protein S5
MVDNKIQQNQSLEVKEELVKVTRTSKVVKGGRQFSFSALVVVGDGNGKVGFGLGKAKEVPAAIAKAVDCAKKAMKKFELHGVTLQHPIVARHGATKVFMRPASPGTGIIAGGAMRPIFKVMGVQDVLAKIIGSANAVNVVAATINGLSAMTTPVQVAKKRGLSRVIRGQAEISGENNG